MVLLAIFCASQFVCKAYVSSALYPNLKLKSVRIEYFTQVFGPIFVEAQSFANIFTLGLLQPVKSALLQFSALLFCFFFLLFSFIYILVFVHFCSKIYDRYHSSQLSTLEKLHLEIFGPQRPQAEQVLVLLVTSCPIPAGSHVVPVNVFCKI